MPSPEPTPSWPPADTPQRRLEAAAVQLAAQRGPEQLTVAAICQQAALAQAFFWEWFGSPEECLLAGADRGTDALQVQIRKAASAGQPRSVVRRTLACFEADQALGRVILRQLPQLGEAGRRRRERLNELVSGGIDGAAADMAPTPPRWLGTMVAGGLVQVLGQHETPLSPERAMEITDSLAVLWSPWLDEPAPR